MQPAVLRIGGTVKKSQTVTGKRFYYEGDLAHGLIVSTSDDQGHAKEYVKIHIRTDTVGIIKNEIRMSRGITMGACRDNPTPGSLGYKLLHQHNKSPQNLSYVIPLLVEEGFCTTSKHGRSYIVWYTGR